VEGAFGWISQIIDWLGRWIPRILIVDTTHAAVKFVWGKNAIPLGPGWYLWWPISTLVTVYPTARQACDLKAQTITTQDGRTVIVGGLLVYEISDVLAAVATTYEPEETAKTIVLCAIHDVCAQYSWAQLQEHLRSGSLGKEMKAEAKKDLDRYGVKVLSLTLTDLAPCRVLKLVTSSTGIGMGNG
jgi:regulator of protease activity HflC (stomatin/prohibitin superfamily)